jgi:hypothetical protein
MTRHTIGRLLFMFGMSLVLSASSPVERGVEPRAELRAQAGPVTSALPTLQGHAAVAELEKRGVYGSLQQALEAARYRVYQEGQRTAAWYAENPAQQIRAHFTPDGVQLQAKARHGHPPRIDMKLRSVGYGERLIGVGAARLTPADNRIEYRRTLLCDDAAGGDVMEWYVNTPAGLEQGFTIESAPGERREGERLRVTLTLESELRAQTVEDGQALEFTDAAGHRVVRYDHLVVTDARGRELESRMAVRLERGEVWLDVDDRGVVWPVTIDPTFTLQQKLVASDGFAQAFGWSVAISGDTVVVGTHGDAVGPDQGSAFVFVRSGGIWIEQQKLSASDAAAGDLFGYSVAISGETIVVGTPFDDGAAGLDQGSAYVFVRSGDVWSEQQKLEASDAAAHDLFGDAVAISRETVVVGAPTDDDAAGENQGSAYYFVRSGGVWSEQQKLEASDAAPDDAFGVSVAISGETVVVGAQGDDGAAGFDQGSAYVFVRSGGVWSEQQKLEASDAAALDSFGWSVAISGETIVVGAPFDDGAAGENQGSAYVFVRSGGVWSEQQKLEASDAAYYNVVGLSVAISGETLMVGAVESGSQGTFQGSAYVFVRTDRVWSEQQRLKPSDAEEGAVFGHSVAISAETVVVGAPGNSGAYVFVADTPPTISLNAPISFWPPNHMYRNVAVSQMVQSASDPEDGNLLNAVIIEKVTSDEPDDAPGGNDGNTSNDVVIGGTCTSVALRSERAATKNGRVYSVTLRAADSAGNITRAVFKVGVPHDLPIPAIADAPVLTVTSTCP